MLDRRVDVSAIPERSALTPVVAVAVTLTVVVPPNDVARLEQALAADPKIGAVILEPTGQ